MAHTRENNGIVLESLATVHYLLGDYFDSITLGDEAYRKLMEDGNVGRALNLCFVIAAAYSIIRNPNKSNQYYNRILALTNRKNQRAQVYYNVGSTYLVSKEYSKALHNFNQAYNLLKDHNNHEPTSYLLLLQKLFLTYMCLEKKDEAKVYLSLTSDFYKQTEVTDISESIKASYKWMTIMFNRRDYLQDEEYLQSIITTYVTSLKDSHHGLHIFYGNYLIEAYKMQRKYKDALRITESLYVKQ